MRQVKLDPKGVRNLLDFVNAAHSSVSFSSFNSDAPFREDLRAGVFAYTDLHSEPQDVARTKLRYLAALFPDVRLHELATILHGVVDNSQMSLQDVRLILEGRALGNPQVRLRETPVETIQSVGRLLMKGHSLVSVSRMLRVSIDTVKRISHYCGILEARENALLDAALLAVGEGESVRKFAARKGLPRSTAGKLMKRARQVLVEMEEMPQEDGDVSFDQA
jgi:transposase-like protein